MDKRDDQLVRGPGGKVMTRREFLLLPIEERRQAIAEQISAMFDNIPGEDRIKEMHDMMD
jgi:hypothetical protein